MSAGEYTPTTHGMWRIKNGTAIETRPNWIAFVIDQAGPKVRVMDPTGIYVFARERIVKNGRKYEVQ